MNESRRYSITWKPVGVVSALVCCLMLGAVAGVPWLFMEPYEDDHRHQIAHESTDAFDYSDLDSDPTPIDELSPAARAVVDRGVTASQNGDSGGRATYTVAFCRDEMPVCDREHPDEFAYSSASVDEHVIETENGVYLLKTSDSAYGADVGPFGDLDIGTVISVISLLAVMVGLAFVAITGFLGITPGTGGEPNPKVVLGLAVYGLLLTVVGNVDPILQMKYGFTVFRDFLPVWIPVTWGILLVSVFHPIFSS